MLQQGGMPTAIGIPTTLTTLAAPQMPQGVGAASMPDALPASQAVASIDQVAAAVASVVAQPVLVVAAGAAAADATVLASAPPFQSNPCFKFLSAAETEAMWCGLRLDFYHKAIWSQ